MFPVNERAKSNRATNHLSRRERERERERDGEFERERVRERVRRLETKFNAHKSGTPKPPIIVNEYRVKNDR